MISGLSSLVRGIPLCYDGFIKTEPSGMCVSNYRCLTDFITKGNPT